eukprot:215760-Heterocapsa_arctica.AAC.1
MVSTEDQIWRRISTTTTLWIDRRHRARQQLPFGQAEADALPGKAEAQPQLPGGRCTARRGRCKDALPSEADAQQQLPTVTTVLERGHRGGGLSLVPRCR